MSRWAYRKEKVWPPGREGGPKDTRKRAFWYEKVGLQ
jgi:hypothetical protein